MEARIVQIERIGLTVTDLDASRDFYRRALGFEEIARERREGPAFAALTALPGARAEMSVMRLGKQEIELAAFVPAGEPYPRPRSAADPWFQHFAIVTADMEAAFDALASVPGWTPISANGPQLLPPEKGSIIAFKFRDPDGHPLELSYFPPEIAGTWGNAAGKAVFLGIDHSALAVARLDASCDFYVRRLGMSLAGRQLNAGPTQAGLDGLPGATVEIASLRTQMQGPHLELLAYRNQPRRDAAPRQVNDVAATRLIARVENLAGLLASPDVQSVSAAAVELPEGCASAIIRTPDGHLIQLREC